MALRRIPLEPKPQPIESGTARLKARGATVARRAACDCGTALRTFAKQKAKGSLELVHTLYCPVCDEWQTIEKNFRRETLVSAPDPRHPTKQVDQPMFKAMRAARVCFMSKPEK